MDIPGRVCAAARPGHRREPHEDWCFLSLGAQEAGCGEIAEITVAREDAVCSSTSGVNSSFGYLAKSHLLGEQCKNYAVRADEAYTLVI